MNFNLMPSLQRMTAIKIATTLWSQNDIIPEMLNCNLRIFTSRQEKNWQKIENKIMRKVLQLPYPKIIKGKIIACIKPVGLQILNWMKNDLISLIEHQVAPYLSRPVWTPQGRLDKTKSAAVLISDANIDIIFRYKLACVYCIEDDVRKLWNKMSEDTRKIFCDCEYRKFSFQQLVNVWTYHINNKQDTFSDIFGRNWNVATTQVAFEYVAENGNKPATEYFLKKMTPGEIQASLAKIVEEIAESCHIFANTLLRSHKESYTADVFRFLLSQMAEEDRIMLLQRTPYPVLKCFLNWPWQSLFMEMASYVWDSLLEYHYYVLLEIIVVKVIKGYKDFDYQNLFREFWQNSPSAHKRYVIDMCASEWLLIKLLRIKDEYTIRLILRDANNIEKGKLIFSDRGQDLCQGLIVDNEWDLLEFFVKESVQSNDEINVLKYTFKEHIRRCCSREDSENNNEEWNKFFKLLNDLISVRDKSAETSDSTA